MPLPPYHVGPSLLFGALLPRVLDVPVFLIASLAIDLEVPVYSLVGVGLGTPRYGHTYLVGGAIGIACAVFLLPLRRPLARLMRAARLPSTPSVPRSLLSGLLGAWLHVTLDGAYRLGAGVFWPSRAANPLCRFDRGDVELLCVAAGIAGALVYARVVARSRRERGAGKGPS